MAKIDPDKLSVEELKALLQKKKDQAGREWQTEGYKLKKEIDAYVLREFGAKLTAWGKKPADLYMCPNPDSKVKKGDQFRYPKDKTGPKGETVYTFSGKGVLPKWLQGNEETYRITPEADTQEAA